MRVMPQAAAVRRLVSGLFLLLVIGGSGPVAAGTLVLEPDFVSVEPGSAVDLLFDETGTLTFDELQYQPNAPWQAAEGPLKFGFRADTLWLRLTLRQDSASAPHRVLLQIGTPVLDEIDVFLMHDQTLMQTLALGDTRPHDTRPLFHRYFLIPVEFAQNREATIYLRIRTDGALQVPLRVWETASFVAHEERVLGARGLVYGAIFTLLATLLLANLTTRRHGFGVCVLFILCQLGYQTGIDGLAGQYLWRDNPWLNQHAIAIAVCLMVASGAAATASFLDAGRNLPTVDPWLTAIAVFFLLLLSGTLMLPARSVFPVLIPLTLIFAAVAVAIGAYAMQQKHVPLAGLFTLVMACFLIGITLSALEQSSVFGPWPMPVNTMLLSSLIQAVLLTWALALHLRQARKQRVDAQEEALATQQLAVAKQRELKEALKVRIDERSAELWTFMRKLESTSGKLAELSRRDGLTGVYNRRYFDERYPPLAQLASRRQQPLAVMLIDIDHFKKLNDTYGHAAGDEALRRIASTIQHIVTRTTDILARYGGEEFIVLLPDTDADEAALMAEAIRAAIDALVITVGQFELRTSASIGIAVRPPAAGEQPGVLVAEADKALYHAKHNGRNRVEVYT